MNGIIADIVLAAVFVLVFWWVARRGFLKSVYKLFALAATVFLVSALMSPVTQAITSGKVWTQFRDNIEQYLYDRGGGGSLNIPEYIISGDTIEGLRSSAADTAAGAIAVTAAKIAAAVGLFLIIRLLLHLLFVLLSAVFKLPVLSGLNKLFGGISALFHALAAVYILCAVVSIPADMFDTVQSSIAQSYIAKFFYDNNLLIKLFI